MLKKLILALINKVFGLKLTEGDLDVLIALLKTLIGLFGSKDAAMAHVHNLVRTANLKEPKKAKKLFEVLEKMMGEV